MTAAYPGNIKLRATDSSIPFGTNEAKILMHRIPKIGFQQSANGSRIRCLEVKVNMNLFTLILKSLFGNVQRTEAGRKSSKK
jgi:hypothetical protein